MKKQAEAWEMSERAWVSWDKVNYIDFHNTKDAGELVGTRFSVEWINAGHTPAIKMNILSLGLVVPKDSPVPTFSPPPEDINHRSLLIPNVPIDSSPFYFHQSDIEALKDGKVRLFLYSRVTYETTFSREDSKYTEVCFEIICQGVNSRTKEIIYGFTPKGPQNSAI